MKLVKVYIDKQFFHDILEMMEPINNFVKKLIPKVNTVPTTTELPNTNIIVKKIDDLV